MILSPHLLTIFEKCRRRFAYERRWELLHITRWMLMERIIRAAVQSENPESIAEEIAMQAPAKGELSTNADTNNYTVARNLGALGGILGVFLRHKIGPLKAVKPFTSHVDEWESQLFEDREGNLHRIVLVDQWDDDRLTAEAHSWSTIGELITHRKSFQMHSIVIGPTRTGRRHSFWTKGFYHPTMKRLRFAKRDKKRHAGLEKSWIPVFREDRLEFSTLQWLKAMNEDRVIEDLYKVRTVTFNALDSRIKRAEHDMRVIRKRMGKVTENSIMSRSACDSPLTGSCPFSVVCWGKAKTTPGSWTEKFRDRTLVRIEAKKEASTEIEALGKAKDKPTS